MLVHEQYRKCVAFLVQDDIHGAPKAAGSAFFVSHPVGQSMAAAYIVTARHVVEGARGRGRPLFLRVNQADGRAPRSIVLDPDDWHISDDTDLALHPATHNVIEDADIQWIWTTHFATSSVVKERRVGPGDEVFFSGLFSEHPGVGNVEPAVRFGNISMMPNDRVLVKGSDGTHASWEAYLVEARSWGGQSGSPAFVYFPPDREPGFLTLPTIDDPDNPGSHAATPLLLGVVSGHFDLKSDVAFATDDGIPSALKAKAAVNSGIAIVIPAQKIIDMLESEPMKDEHDRAIEATARQRPAGTLDSTFVEKSDEFQRFEDLARKLVQVPKEEVDELREGEKSP